MNAKPRMPLVRHRILGKQLVTAWIDTRGILERLCIPCAPKAQSTRRIAGKLDIVFRAFPLRQQIREAGQPLTTSNGKSTPEEATATLYYSPTSSRAWRRGLLSFGESTLEIP
ncbi:hypothetical protein TGRH88_029960 [Toxoplasma gondii]|uniref:Uncharacterized protein n=1 Tax=Toxoplasma gondii TaxID=5811 RepID=A0A7J6K8W2_TOXGO|nr:hypothetical protein TGRH88_029960 [Toxoplasma gondii]